MKSDGSEMDTKIASVKEELKQYILDNAFDGWKDATDDDVLRCIDEFFSEHYPMLA